MTMTKVMKRAAAVLFCAILAVVFSAAVPGMNAHAATKYKLPKTITEYSRYGDNDMQLASKETYTYNKKGDATKIVRQVYDNGTVTEKSTFSLKYTYKKGKKTKVVVKRNGKKYAVMKFNKKGQLIKLQHIYGKFNHTYKYGKKGYLTLINWKDPYDKGTIKYKTSFKNGKLYQIQETMSGNDADDIIDRYQYEGSGLITVHKRNAGDVGWYDTWYAYEKKKGLVIRKYVSDEDFSSIFVYSYSKKKVNHNKYNKVINRDPRTIVGTLFQ